MGLLGLMWKDCRNVTIMSTAHTAAMDMDKLLVAKDYNITIKGVNASYYLMTHRPKVWYRKVFVFLFDMPIVNA